MKVHRTLGNGFQEVISQRCLVIELKKTGLNFGREMEQTIYYEGEAVGTRRADFVVEDKVIVELKALVNLEDVHLAQAKNYVVAYVMWWFMIFPSDYLLILVQRVYNSKRCLTPNTIPVNPKIK